MEASADSRAWERGRGCFSIVLCWGEGPDIYTPKLSTHPLWDAPEGGETLLRAGFFSSAQPRRLRAGCYLAMLLAAGMMNPSFQRGSEQLLVVLAPEVLERSGSQTHITWRLC